MSEITLASRILSTGLVRPWPPVQRPRHRHRETDRLEARIGKLEDELRRCRTMAAQTERLGRIGSWVLDLDGGALAWSEGTYHIFGLTPGHPVTLEQATGFYSGPVQARLGTVVEEAIASGQPYDITLQHTTADNTERWVRSIGQIEIGADGVRRLSGMVRDVTSECRAEDQLRHLASHDPLTGLGNRRLLLETLEQAMPAAQGGGGLTLVLLDVDHFKSVNDAHGHGAGDALLIEIARRLRAGLRGQDMVARLGGDEFALILDGAAGTTQRLAALLALFDDPVQLSCGTLNIGVSLGAAIHLDEKSGPDTLLRNADIALYEAKSLGRGQACLFRRSLGAALEQRLSLLDEVRLGLQRDEFDVFYQPIVDLRTLVVRGLEALVRWRHPTRGLLSPAAFAAALADPLLSARIGSFVMARSLRQMRQWIDAGQPVTCVNVNISESQLLHGDELFRQVTALLKAHDLKPDRLKLEILESAFLSHQPEAIAATLTRLQRLGVVVALDDFGTGYASLTHLKQFNVGRIKIDQSFIRGLCTDASNLAITRAIIDLGYNLGMRVVAEGIEEVSQLALLLTANCDCGQGYLFSRPMPAEAVPDFLSRWQQEGPALLAAAGSPPHALARMQP